MNFTLRLSWDSMVDLRCQGQKSLQTRRYLTPERPQGLKTGENTCYFLWCSNVSQDCPVFPPPYSLCSTCFFSKSRNSPSKLGWVFPKQGWGERQSLKQMMTDTCASLRPRCHLSRVTLGSIGRMCVSFSLFLLVKWKHLLCFLWGESE